MAAAKAVTRQTLLDIIVIVMVEGDLPVIVIAIRAADQVALVVIVKIAPRNGNVKCSHLWHPPARRTGPGWFGYAGLCYRTRNGLSRY